MAAKKILMLAGDLLIIDWGACRGGYASNLTRTFAVGEIDAETEKIDKIVKQAKLVSSPVVREGGWQQPPY